MPLAVTKGATATIANAASTSDLVDLGLTDGSAEIVGFVMPPAFTGSTLTFNVTNQDPNNGGPDAQPLYDNTGAAVSITVAGGRVVALKQDFRALLGRFRYIQLVSGSAETAQRKITILVK